MAKRNQHQPVTITTDAALQSIGENTEAAFADGGDNLVIRVALDHDGRPSSTGLSKLFGTTGGNTKWSGLEIGCNVMEPDNAAREAAKAEAAAEKASKNARRARANGDR
jgi:hypothetical protein